MDEILASIRRIIESSDTKPGAAAQVSSAARVAAVDRAMASRDPAGRSESVTPPTSAARIVPFTERTVPADDPVAADSGEVEGRWAPPAENANDAGEPPLAAHAAADVEEPLELRDTASSLDMNPPEEQVAATARVSSVEPGDASKSADRWAQELDDVKSWTVLDAVKPAAPSVAEPSVEAAAEPAVESVPETEASALVSSPVDVAPSPENDDDFMVDFNEADFVEAIDRNVALVTPPETERTAFEPANAPSAVASPSPARMIHPASSHAPLPSTARSEPEPAVSAPSVLQQTSALMSEEAGVQVAAAFNDLSRAIRDGQMKSMEEMGREMLRPMLQEWLDDNLPHLVERLVREEIERVSRGGRR